MVDGSASMKRIVFATMLLAVPVLAWSQATPAGAKPKAKPVSPYAEYAGEWSSVFGGREWLHLHLQLNGEQLTGSLVHPHSIDLNDNGELKSVSEELTTEALVDAVVNPDGLLLTLKDADTQETNRYMMRLVPAGKDTADLKMIGMKMPPGMPKPKPWRVVKSGIASTNGVAQPR